MLTNFLTKGGSMKKIMAISSLVSLIFAGSALAESSCTTKGRIFYTGGGEAFTTVALIKKEKSKGLSKEQCLAKAQGQLAKVAAEVKASSEGDSAKKITLKVKYKGDDGNFSEVLKSKI